MQENASRRGAADLGMPLMILAFLVIGGFMWWLKGQSDAEFEARELAAAELAAEEARQDSIEAFEASTTDINALIQPGVDMDQFEGETIRGMGYEVASQLGTQGFWVNTEYGNPFLVVYTEELRAAGASVTQGDVVELMGELLRMEPSYLDEWEAEGTISASDRVIAEFATHLVAANQVTVTGRAPAGGDGGEGAGG